MATPQGGGPSYGDGRDQQAHSDPTYGVPDTPTQRFNFPSGPSRHVRAQRQQSGPPPRESGGYQPSWQQQRPAGNPQQGSYGAPRNTGGRHSQHGAVPSQRAETTAPMTGRQEPSEPRGDQQPLVRPYAMTGGRTRPRYQLALEALVHTTADPSRLQGQLPEHQRICRLCYEIKSVAEISALLSIPLGVARILVADLAEAGLVAIHQPGGGNETVDGQPDVTLLERVLSGLRKL
ncbi:DUF742 domain-containing protein [Streptomyces sp. NPDC005438]|uniref:DUF742 domain-containing protein n=1 Tax=Streptomyces sp. NPDC005438 TaxID=3156880 RepID=UPI0033BCC6CF